MRAYGFALAALALSYASGVSAQEPERTFAPELPEPARPDPFVRDGDRIFLSFGSFELEHARVVHTPLDTTQVRQERVYLSREWEAGVPRMSLWRERERQDFPGGVKQESFGFALNWRF